MCKCLGIVFVGLLLSTPIKLFANNNYIESTDIGVGVNHVCANTSLGVKCFGNSETKTLNAPASLKNSNLLSAGNRFSCAIETAGIRCWGEIPGRSESSILIGAKTLKNPRLLSVGYDHACAVSEKDEIKCWGKNDFGESTPPKKLKNISEISLGMSNSCAIASNQVVCWGGSFAGSTTIPDNIQNPRNITSGWWHHCALSDEGIKCWGYPYKEYTAPDDASIISFSSGGFFNCALVAEGVKCWDETGKTSLVEDSLSATKISVGSTVGCAITIERGLICWQLATGKFNRLKSYVPAGRLLKIENVAAGNASTCVYGDEDRLLCWGYNPDGALNVPSTIPRPINKMSLGNHRLCTLTNNIVNCYGDKRIDYETPKNLGTVTMVSSGGYQICAASSAKMRCWGDDVRDALIIPKNLTSISEISSGFTHACAVANNEVNCWGGTGLIKNVNPGVRMFNPKAICAGGTFSCGISAEGKVSCWGTKIPFAGDVDPDNAVVNVPNEIESATEIACGQSHACAIYDGKIKCWGNGSFLPERLTPKAVIKNPHNLTAGWNHTCTLGDQGLSCWGNMLNLEMPNYALEK